MPKLHKNVPGNKTAMLAKMFHPKALRGAKTRVRTKPGLKFKPRK